LKITVLLIIIATSIIHYTVHSQYIKGGQYGGVLVQAIVGDPPHLNPGITTSVATLIATAGIFESLLRWDDSMNPYPALAERWEISEDGKIYTFYLVRNATWHDGTPFTAYDVKFSLETILKKYHPRARVVLASLDRVDVIDNYTVRVYFKEPNPAFLYILNVHNAPMLPAHLLSKYADDPSKAPFNEKPIGTGPFRFVEWVKGQYVRLEKNPNYYLKGYPYLDGIVTRIYRDPLSAVVALEKGEVDYITGYYMPLSEAKRLQNISGITITGSGASIISPIFVMFYNLDLEPTNNKDFRKAIAYAIDRQAILDKVFFGFGKIATGPIPSSHWAYNPNVTKYEYNPELAKRILDNLGFRDIDGDGYREFPNGSKLTLVLPYNSGVAFHERTAQLLAEMLRGIGIRVELRAYDEATLTTVVYNTRSFHITVERFSTGPDPSIGIARLYHSSYASSKVPFTNAASGYKNPTVDKLLDSAAKIADKGERARLYGEFQRIVADELPIYVLLEVYDPNAYRSIVRGLHAWSAESRVERVDVWIQQQIAPVTVKQPETTANITQRTPTQMVTGQAVTVTQAQASGLGIEYIVAIAIGVAMVVVAIYIIYRRRS